MKINRLAIALLELRTDPPPSLLIVFGCGLLITGIVVNYLSSLLISFSTTFPSLPIVITILITLLAFAIYAYRQFENKLEAKMHISEHSNVPPASYVISALSPLQPFKEGGDNLENIRRLLLHHQPSLQEFHLISVLDMQNGKLVSVNPQLKDSQGVIDAFNKLDGWMESKLEVQPHIRFHPIIDPNGAQDSFEKVNKLLVNFSANPKIERHSVVVDVTAGTKAMTVGMAAAALINGYSISYQATKRDAEGKPDFTANTRDTSMVYLTLDQQFRLKE
jgi:CRISPR-associated protein (Cas_Cas02710)